MDKFSDFLHHKRAIYCKEPKFDGSDLSPQFVPYFNSQERITVKFSCGTIRRGRVGVTTGWKPVFLLMLTVRSRGSAWILTNSEEIILTEAQTVKKEGRF